MEWRYDSFKVFVHVPRFVGPSWEFHCQYALFCCRIVHFLRIFATYAFLSWKNNAHIHATSKKTSFWRQCENKSTRYWNDVGLTVCAWRVALDKGKFWYSSRTSMARTLMARLPCLTRTRSWVPIVLYLRLLWSNFYFNFFILLSFIFYFSDRWSLKIENENNNTKTLTIEIPYNYRTRAPRVLFINIETYPGWLELPLTGIFMVPSLFEQLKFYCIVIWILFMFIKKHTLKEITSQTD